MRAYTRRVLQPYDADFGKELAKTIVLWAGEEMISAVLPAPNHVRLDKLAAEVGKSVRLATEAESQSLPDCELGGHAAFGSLYNFACVRDESLAPMRRLSSTPGRTATRFACGTTTLFVWRSPVSVHSLERVTQMISGFLVIVATGLSSPFFGCR